MYTTLPMHALTSSIKTLPITPFANLCGTVTKPAARTRIQSVFKEYVQLPPEIVMYNKNQHLVAYGNIDWHHPTISPFSILRIPAISKLHITKGYLSDPESIHLIHLIERRMMRFGHLSFGAAISNHPDESQRIDLLVRSGYDHQILTTDNETVYLIKCIKLLA